MTKTAQSNVSGLFTDRQAAEFLNCTRGALERWRRERRGPPYIKLGRLVRYARHDLVKWLAQKRIQTPDTENVV
jgi:excisionase family DNA binding protein